MEKIRKINKFKFEKIYRKKCPGYQYIPSTLPPVERLLVLGDIHGDYNLLITMLKLGNVISCPDNPDPDEVVWTGGSTYIVQVGDQIDDCRPINGISCETQEGLDGDLKILNLCTKLHHQAVQTGGAFISLLGNHEILNILGDTTYVSKSNLEIFHQTYPTFTTGSEARRFVFTPGNDISVMLGCSRLPAVIIGTHLFVHAGIIDALITELGIRRNSDLETINMALKLWLLGILREEYITELIKFTGTSMFWTRILGDIPPGVKLTDPRCADHITHALKIFRVGNIVIGHTPQSFIKNLDINQTCSGRVWRVDNGSSRAFDKFDQTLQKTGEAGINRRPQILEIVNDKHYFIIDKNGRREV